MPNSVVILGAGTQGRRLAYMWSSRGLPVRLIDQKPAALVAALSEIENLKSTVGMQSSHKGGNITTSGPEELPHSLKDAWLVVENVPESLQLKRSVVEQLDKFASPHTIIASNSSSFTISEIISGLGLQNLQRCVSLHSYWPPETSAIEVMGTDATDPKVIPKLMEACRDHGFTPFHVRKSSNGYIYNRIWAAIKREALSVVAEGVATPEETDAIYKNILKTPVGPFEQMDVVGLDVVKDIEEHYAEKRNGIPQVPRDLLAMMIRDGKLGVKTGEGFYKY